jgi:hypothetical protein
LIDDDLKRFLVKTIPRPWVYVGPFDQGGNAIAHIQGGGQGYIGVKVTLTELSARATVLDEGL